MVSLRVIASALGVETADVELRALCNDTRKVTTGSLFIALKGLNFDARKEIGNAIKAGAVAVIYEDTGDGFVPDMENYDVPCIGVPGLAEKQSLVASAFYGCPSAGLDLIGVTGTNGKSTITHLIATWLTALGRKTGILGTLGTGFYPNLIPCANTTLAAIDLERTISELSNDGAKAIAMEVSSHGIALKRVSELKFKIAAFTNLSRDHLDFHKTMKNYAETKFQLMKSVLPEMCVINADDSTGVEFISRIPEALTYSKQGLYGGRGIYAHDIVYYPHGINFKVSGSYGDAEFTIPLIGSFNVDNVLCAIGVLLLCGYSLKEMEKTAGVLRAVTGRMECFSNKNTPLLIVDYAHTPDGLEKALAAVKEHKFGKITCICGCGGDRDTGKRTEMAAIACGMADHVIFTNDNPRTENPDSIIEMMLAGVKDCSNYEVVKDRRSAIEVAFSKSVPGDVLLIAGKGHEDYQIIGKTKYHYSDREVAMELTGDRK